MKGAFILHSGGIDSTTCLAIAYDKFEKNEYQRVESVSIYYGQRHEKEMLAARAVADHYGCDHTTLQLGEQPKSMLTDASVAVPHMSYADIKGVSPTYVPFRNGQLLSRIAAHAAAWVTLTTEVNLHRSSAVTADIYFGAHAEDAAGWAYPDCTPEFIGAMANAIYIGTYAKVRLLAPLTYMMKPEIIMTGSKLHAPYDLTWSCYKGEDFHCGQCPTCRARHEGFEKAGQWDPTIYLSPAWEPPPAAGDTGDEIPF